ncbi:MAG TPA: hypothetical protein G4N93_06975 [Dehalococcoidia bacterium]|nr:hypothetical protein [Dehalococcoidia bacterium]
MDPRPRARGEDEYGVVLISYNMLPEYPEVIVWDKKYETECDRLSEKAARLKKGVRRWGRWYLNTMSPASLDTEVWSPSVGYEPERCIEIYDIVLCKCRTESQRRQWIDHMGEKCWVGTNGLDDLRRAFMDLAKVDFEMVKS